MVVTTGNCSTAVGCSETFLHKPSLTGSVVLLAIFAILIPIAFALGVRYQASVFATIIITGLALEVLGYIGRLLLAVDDASTKTDFILSLVGTILGPTIIALALFRLLPPIVATYGDGFQAWRPQWHNSVFYAFTAVCVVLQVVGAVMATVPRDANAIHIGIRLLVAGLAIHLSSILLFALLGLRFALAVHQRQDILYANKLTVHNTQRFKTFLIATEGLSLAVLLLTIRAIYRLVPISQGFGSPVARDEVLFLVLDGVMVLLAVIAALASFPGRLLGTTLPSATIQERRFASRPERPYPTAPVQLQPSYAPTYYRQSIKSSKSYSPRHNTSPRKYNSPQQNMVDSEALW
ncbi:phospholipid-translocating ATPase [Apiospora hydei]|uniref:Phospholipid-translocating ATPase n=1 Tax=Apiospora hydei TaxID=1337664 RepID=A0ABR1WML2_9PEZI